MENINEQTLSEQNITQTAGAEIEQGVKTQEVSLGKFKDANALLSAYNSLQSEFTKRCQKIKELEQIVNKVDKVNDETLTPTQVECNENRVGASGITDKDKENILKDYLKEILDSKSKAIVLDSMGSGIKTPCAKPKTIEEAGKLAKEMLNS